MDAERATSILVVEDDENILNLLSAYLESAGHGVTTATDGADGLERALNGGFDICILDVLLPRRSGIEIAADLREAGSETPILFLTALGSEADVLKGFGAGGDDYMVKPFSPRELMVRVDAILRRSAPSKTQDETGFAVGPIQLDTTEPFCRVNGARHELTPFEHKILGQFLRRPGRVFERSTLIASIYGNDAAVSPKAIDVHIHNLRAKLGEDAGAMIETVRGFGYRLAPPGEASNKARYA
ncbi:MAG: response regulator transcription factor [Pseudomonadota bacterium]